MTNSEIKSLVTKAQNDWAHYVIDIGAQHSKGNDINKLMDRFLSDLYAFEISDVLFKPTKACIKQFRRTREDFVSYFIAKNNLHKEDKGFALEPWIKIVFDNFNTIKVDREIISMGNYSFEDCDRNSIKVEYTFGYIIDDMGKLRINLHHSSLPFKN